MLGKTFVGICSVPFEYIMGYEINAPGIYAPEGIHSSCSFLHYSKFVYLDHGFK